jgi:heme-degrading monooxygenase HmoA
MYLAMNRFAVRPESAKAFEELWLGRDSHLKEMKGFVEFHMLKGPEREDGTILYASHTVWESEAAFRAWTTSEQFRKAHAGAGDTRKLHEGHPQFEGFAAIQHIAKEPADSDAA